MIKFIVLFWEKKCFFEAEVKWQKKTNRQTKKWIIGKKVEEEVEEDEEEDVDKGREDDADDNDANDDNDG